ncbi:MAG: fumarylacetoacetate hydrolase family protein [Xanthomonadaceae bacterium]|nr:fumarylacetoacetate hydrolase family protein [Xanthomonadaceae bacterium]
MKFVYFTSTVIKEPKLGILVEKTIVDLSPTIQFLELSSQIELFSNIQFVMENSASLLPIIKQVEKAAMDKKVPEKFLTLESDAKFHSPIPKPVSVRDGYAFRQHVESARKGRGLPMIPEFDLFPIFYFTNAAAITGPGDVAVQKTAAIDLDFELEVAIVIGKKGKNIPAAKADEHIFGYMVMNDWSARHLQREEMKLNLGPAKGKDFATSIGPYLVTRDELEKFAVKGPKGERHNLRMQAWLNEKKVSDGNVKDMTWTFGEIIERASYGVTLSPGEVIGSGTVGTGCFMELNATKTTDNLWIKPGDRMILEVEGLGRLENKVVAASDDYET